MPRVPGPRQRGEHAQYGRRRCLWSPWTSLVRTSLVRVVRGGLHCLQPHERAKWGTQTDNSLRAHLLNATPGGVGVDVDFRTLAVSIAHDLARGGGFSLDGWR